jgi:hypothetical protein
VNVDLSEAFYIVLHSVVLRNFSSVVPPYNYVNWFRSYLVNSQYFVHVSGTISFPYLVKFGVQQVSILDPVLVKIFIKDTGYYVCNSKYLFFFAGYRTIRNVGECRLLQHVIDSVQNWYLFNGMKFNLVKTTAVSFTRKTNSICFNYKVCKNLVSRSQCVKELAVLLGCKLYFHQHIDYILS